MADYSDFEDSFESSSESESDKYQPEVIKGERSEEYQSASYHQFVKNEPVLELSGESLSYHKVPHIGSPKSSPLSRKKFRPHFKKPPGLENIKQKMKKRKKRVFGVSLQTAVYRSILANDGIELPTIFRQCMDYLEENALDQEGIYRLAGVKSQIDNVKGLYDKESEIDLSDYDSNTVASLLKLYLRELPEPLIHLRLLPKLDTVTRLEMAEMQLAILRLLFDELPACNKLLLGWLYVHMSHIVEKSDRNKMGISNLFIVFSPTLQLPINIMYLIYNHRNELFPNIELKRYQSPHKSSTAFDLPNPNSLETEEEVTAELTRLSDLLEKLHTKVHSSDGRYDERDDYCWELQRVVTDLKRRKKVYEQLSASKLGDEQDFMKALILMDVTLQAENDELKITNTILKESIRDEIKQIDSYKSELKLYESRSRNIEDVFLGDESEFAQTMSKLLWQKRELQFQYNELQENIKLEEKKLMQLHIQLRVAPFDN